MEVKRGGENIAKIDLALGGRKDVKFENGRCPQT